MDLCFSHRVVTLLETADTCPAPTVFVVSEVAAKTSCITRSFSVYYSNTAATVICLAPCSMPTSPKNWPSTFPYLICPLHDKALTAEDKQFLGAAPPSPILRIPASTTPTPSTIVHIQPIRDPSHPAHGQHGLFATQALKPGTFILAYLGRVHSEVATDGQSDYDIWLDKDQGLAVDAGKQGNEARFVNDYRGVKPRPNALFGTAWCERWQQLCVAVFADKRKDSKGITKGEEVVVSYGKGFWDQRREP